MKTFDEWFSSKQGEAYDSMYCFARDAWKAAQEVEREECANVCERLISGDGICADDGVWIHDCADAIRARGNN